MGNNNNNKDLVAETINNGSIGFLSELLINLGFISDEERKDDMTTENAKQTTVINTNEHESLISDIHNDLGMELQTSQKKKKRKPKKKKSKVHFSGNKSNHEESINDKVGATTTY